MQGTINFVGRILPLEGLLSYIMQRTIGNFFLEKINLKLLKSGLNQLSINEAYVNTKLLKNSPLKLHSGKIFKIEIEK